MGNLKLKFMDFKWIEKVQSDIKVEGSKKNTFSFSSKSFSILTRFGGGVDPNPSASSSLSLIGDNVRSIFYHSKRQS